ncbi:MAG: hypothetical protein H6Q75_1198 [Firmicutes bacterium]|nr:hypothetical protein [Bacillota bacterium]
MAHKGIQIMLYVIVVIFVLIIIAYIIGTLLPKERVEKREFVYKSPPKAIYDVVTNNNDFRYRSDLKDLQILESDGEFQTWKEVSKNGQSIIFRTIKKEPVSRYEFEIVEANGVQGYWVGEFIKTEQEGTKFISTEHITINNPLFRLLSYLSFDLGKYMENYQKDLAVKLNEDVNQ